VVRHVSGVMDGYNVALSAARVNGTAYGDVLDIVQAFIWNSIGDLGDISNGLYPELRKNCWDSTEEESLLRDFDNNHCSVLLKPIKTDDKLDIGLSHTTWFDYRTMLRVFKTYEFPLSKIGDASTSSHDTAYPFISVMFSSYPGVSSSYDDFYVIADRGLYVTETTNGICDGSLFGLITPTSAMTWFRTIIANLLATDGQSWTQHFQRYNSGTYNNQFMIVNTRLFNSSSSTNSDGSLALPLGVLWIIEQMPGKVQSGDVTPVVNSMGYWPSYNRPYFPDIFDAMGYTKAVQAHGDSYSYAKCARANIFRRDQSNVVDLTTLKWLLTSNNYKTDPLSLGNPTFAISSRGDLLSPKGRAGGGTDCKVTSALRMQSNVIEVQGISGPTHAQQEPFSWTGSYANISHVGQPLTFNFDWQIFTLVASHDK